jgi:type III secretion system YscD/HrpQ family protein
MAGFLIAEEGPLAGLIIRFDEENEWVIGRDPDVSVKVLEDPMVSRKHVICRLTDKGYVIENLSAINPATVNGKSITEPTLLQEGDTVQIGNLFFRFTTHDPSEVLAEEREEKTEVETPTIYEEEEELEALAFGGRAEARWIIKVISGPNAGAEFGVHEGSTYIIGKDPNTCDILFQDLSVSRQHAKIVATMEGIVTIEDLKSLNKVLINGQEIKEPTKLNTQDLVALGTTSFLIIDKQETRETIVSPPSGIEPLYMKRKEEKEAEIREAAREEEVAKNWKMMKIPIRHLVLAGLFAILLLLGLGGVFSLFKSKPVPVVVEDESQEIHNSLKNFPEVEFSFNPTTGKLFLLGHVLTEVDHQEMVYLLKSHSFVQSIEDNVIIDELVWESTNALLTKNPNWRGVTLSSIVPGYFVLRGYVQSIDEAVKLSEYINVNFPYLDRLDNQVVVENTLQAQIQSILLEKGFISVTFQFANGELILAGRVSEHDGPLFHDTVDTLKKMKGVRMVKNFVILTKPVSDIIDLTAKYTVTGSSKLGTISEYIVINGKILSKGDTLDGMKITKIDENIIFLEKDGLKYKINYNQQ